VWCIFTRDLIRILRNPVALVVTFGVAIIPSLYAWFNILANWDPYSATGNLQVAVANDDKGASNDLVGDLNAGKQVVSELKKNDELGWRFVSEEKALEGVQSGEYYAAIVLPKDFSESLVDSVTGSGTRPKIKYYVNEKKNAIAPKITDTGATTIDEQINSTFVSTVSNAVASAISQAGNELDEATTSTQNDVIGDLNKVIDSIGTVNTALADTQTTLHQADTAIADAKRTTAALKSTVAAARQASKQSGTLLSEAQTGSQSFANTLVGALDNGSIQLSGLAVNANNAAGTVIGSFNTAQSSVDAITDAISRPLDATAATLGDLKDALNKAGLGQDTADPVGQRIWSQINAIDDAVSAQQTQVDAFHKDTTAFITSGKDATGNLSGAVGDTAGGGIAGGEAVLIAALSVPPCGGETPPPRLADRHDHAESHRIAEQLRRVERHLGRHAGLAVEHAGPDRRAVRPAVVHHQPGHVHHRRHADLAGAAVRQRGDRAHRHRRDQQLGDLPQDQRRPAPRRRGVRRVHGQPRLTDHQGRLSHR